MGRGGGRHRLRLRDRVRVMWHKNIFSIVHVVRICKIWDLRITGLSPKLPFFSKGV